jgi:hypothetical protein
MNREEITKNNQVIKAFINSGNKTGHICKAITQINSNQREETTRDHGSNFILKPASNSPFGQHLFKNNQPKQVFVAPKQAEPRETSAPARSLSRSRRRGLHEIFPEIKLIDKDPFSSCKDRNVNELSKSLIYCNKLDEADWCPESDLYDFDETQCHLGANQAEQEKHADTGVNMVAHLRSFYDAAAKKTTPGSCNMSRISLFYY